MDAPKVPTPSPGGSDSKLHFLDYWRVIRIRKTVILAVFLLVVLTTTAVTFILPESYLSTVRISVDKDVSDITPFGFPQASTTFDPYFIQTEFEKIKSKSVLHRVISNLNLTVRFGDRYQEGKPFMITEAYDVLSRMVDVRQTRNTSLIEIRVYSDAKENAPKEAAEIANAIASVYRDTRLELKQSMAQRGIDTLKEELALQDKKVSQVQAELDETKQRLRIPDFMAEGPTAQTLGPETVRQMERERITVEAQYMGLTERLSKLKELRIKGSEELAKALTTAMPDADLSKLLNELQFAEQQLARDSAVYGTNNPTILELSAAIRIMRAQVERSVTGMMEGLHVLVAAKQAELKRLSDLVDEAIARDGEATETYRPYFKLKRELETVQRIRDAVQMRVLQEQVDLAIPKTSMVEITDAAEPGRSPVRPNIPLNIVLGIVVGLVVGVGLAFFIEYLDTSVKTIDDVERALQAPVLGVIPQNVGSLMDEGPESPHAEAYRVLRTNILFSRKNKDANTFTIVSGGAGEGKSTTIFNLCTVFAQNGHRVLLVDSDLRRPSLHKLFKVSNSAGLTNYLLGQSKIEEVIQTSSLPTLDFLPSGKLPSSSLGILNSPQMREFIAEVRKRYDYVFFDSPPIMGVSDASVLASMVDVTMLVIQYRKYPQAMTVRAKQMVEKIGGNLLGVVLNNINISQDSYYYYYSGYYYDYYSKSEDARKDSSGGSGEKKRKKVAKDDVEIETKY